MADINDLDITRDQNDESLLVQNKLFQQNRYALDDELNVIQDIALDRERRILSELIEGGDVRLGTGFTVQGDAAANTVVVQLGGCAVHLDTHHAVLLWIDSNQSVDGWTTPSGSDRTDYLFIDVSIEAFDSEDDANLINPARGEETTWDLRLVWSLEKSEGSTPGTPPAGHKYISIARIERTDGVAVIQTADITDLLDDHFAYLRQDGSKDLQGNLSVDSNVTIDDIDISAHHEVLYRQTLEADFTANDAAGVWDSGTGNCFAIEGDNGSHVKVRFAHKKHKNINYIRAFCEAYYATSLRYVQISTVPATNVDEVEITATTWGSFYEMVIDISGLSDGDEFLVEFTMTSHGGVGNAYARKVGIDATFE